MSKEPNKQTRPFVHVIYESASIPNPQTQIAIAIDTAYIASTGSSWVSGGVYMMDDMLDKGSTGEGTLELSTVCAVGNLIGFTVYPMDTNSGDQVVISGLNVSQGSVFGSAGYPSPQNASGSYWVGQAMNQGNQTYQIQVKVTVGVLHPIAYYINWDPFITAQ